MEDIKMPIIKHLIELRTRLVRSAIMVGIAFSAALYFTKDIIKILKKPLANAELIFISPAEAFWVTFKIAFIVGLIFSLPVVLYELWKFIAPGLKMNERKYGIIFVSSSFVLFVMGLVFCAYVILPFALSYLISYGLDVGMKPMISVGNYIDFVLKFSIAFGLIFELPLAITILSKLGVIDPKMLSKHRKYAVLLAFIVSAILTPTPDVFNQTLMAVPIIILFELGLISARLFGKKREEEGVTPKEAKEGA
ncbi:MAG: twin-arginine translocase subunit TatC [Nitrospirae bacterium]|nr:twin-arginine translocase subunit TatC [Nitrospirota bacterium]